MQREQLRLQRALELLTSGLQPFVEKQMRAVHGDGWMEAARSSFRSRREPVLPQGEVMRWDAHAVLTVLWDHWNAVFARRLGRLERSLVGELREFRNRWAHQRVFGFNDTYRVLDSVERLLRAVDAPEADIVARDKRDLLHERFARDLREAMRKAALRRLKWQDCAVYLVCCAAILFALFRYFGASAWYLALFVAAVFAFLTYRRTIQEPPPFGPAECPECGRIIYGIDCPYCAAEKRSMRPSESPAARS